MFIVIDGIDGSGKGTQLKKVCLELENRGKKVLVLDFPRYGNKSAYAVERYLNGEYGDSVSAKQASVFYALDRYDAMSDLKWVLQDYDYIISNRYVSANMIHQWGKITDPKKRRNFLDWLDDFEYNILWIPRPDMTLFLNVSPDMWKKLVEKKEARKYIKSNNNKDIHEADSEHLQNAHKIACEIVESFEDWIKIDCEENGKMLSIPKITQKILEKII